MLSVYLHVNLGRCHESQKPTHPSRTSDLMLKPKVGLISDVSSPFSFFRIVVLPALSSPLEVSREPDDPDPRRKQSTRAHRNNTRISLDLALFFLMIVRRPAVSGCAQPSSGRLAHDATSRWDPTLSDQHVVVQLLMALRQTVFCASCKPEALPARAGYLLVVCGVDHSPRNSLASELESDP